MESLIEQLAALLKNRGWLLATAESCTGGGLAYALTEISGSSNWFERGLVTYSNAAKTELLGVSSADLLHHGAVSEVVAKAMATGVLQHTPAHLSLAITGIAGPTGGTRDKPVGTVWFAWATQEGVIGSQKKCFPGNRQAIRKEAIKTALEILIQCL